MDDGFQFLSHEEPQDEEENIELLDIFVMDYNFAEGQYLIKPILEEGVRFGEN